ncbi:hypothetical protein GGR56DRAFT_624735 [Xylariaceae sp. FL0804]|nr:hypothetical protein GGR56DRAFT_624735 [Xylariaceae sp. FL0804]
MVDGKFIQRPLLSSGMTDLERGVDIVGKGIFCQKTQHWKIQKCKFSAIKIVDDSVKERIENDKKAAQNLGQIIIQVERVIEARPLRRLEAREEEDARRPANPDEAFELAEKSLKGQAISHSSSWSVGRCIPPPTIYKAEPIAEDDGPIAEYRFYYKSREALKQAMIIPRTPSPPLASSTDSSQGVQNMSREELERLAQERLEQIRRDREGIKEEHKPRIKRELDELVDLTSDDAGERHGKRRKEADFVDLTED